MLFLMLSLAGSPYMQIYSCWQSIHCPKAPGGSRRCARYGAHTAGMCWQGAHCCKIH